MEVSWSAKMEALNWVSSVLVVPRITTWEWYKSIPVKTFVWVANRLNPINDSSGLLKINITGNLVRIEMGWDLWKGIKWRLTAWKSPANPSPRDFTYGIEMHPYLEPVIRKGTSKFYRTGPWNGLQFSGSPDLKPNQIYDFFFVSNEYC
nr:receptor-like serine/threonine-protein kinase sd1-8 [Quercus suber]